MGRRVPEGGGGARPLNVPGGGETDNTSNLKENLIHCLPLDTFRLLGGTLNSLVWYAINSEKAPM